MQVIPILPLLPEMKDSYTIRVTIKSNVAGFPPAVFDVTVNPDGMRLKRLGERETYKANWRDLISKMILHKVGFSRDEEEF